MSLPARNSDVLTGAVINKVPRGLLEYFGLKSGGENPHSIDPQISCGIADLWPFYTKPELKVYTATGTVAAVGNTVGFATAFDCFTSSGVVDQNNIAVVTRAWFQTQNGAAALTKGRLALYLLRVGDTPFAMQTTYLATSNEFEAGTGALASYTGEQLWLRPREAIGGICLSHTGSAANTTCTLGIEFFSIQLPLVR